MPDLAQTHDPNHSCKSLDGTHTGAASNTAPPQAFLLAGVRSRNKGRDAAQPWGPKLPGTKAQGLGRGGGVCVAKEGQSRRGGRRRAVGVWLRRIAKKRWLGGD